MIKLNIGSNDVVFEGWENFDLNPHNGARQHDARKPFPYPDNSIDFIFSEHFIEHLNETEGLQFFRECYRLLKPGGVIRTSTFDIDDLMRNCVSNEKWDIYKEELLSGQFRDKARTEFFNFAVYEGGVHKYMYNPDEMIRFLKVAGFTKFVTPNLRESNHPELQNLEWRTNSNCIVEATR